MHNKIFDDNGKKINTTDKFVTSDPMVMLMYMMFVRAVSVGVIAAIITDLKKNKGKKFVIDDKGLGEFAEFLVQELY